jgi:HAAS domain-containing protein
MIGQYLDRLARELDFDPSLSRQVVQEVEDHLRETVERDAVADRLEAERRAVVKFGDPRAIAAQFAVVSLAALARRVAFTAVLLIGAVFIAMKARVAWYGVMQCPLAEDMRALSAIALTIDRWAFWLALLAGAAGWIYIDSRRAPAALTREYRAELRRFSLLCSAAAAALIVCVAADGLLTALRLIGAQWSAAFIVPLFSVAIEIASAGVLVSYLRAMAGRTMRAACLAPAA